MARAGKGKPTGRVSAVVAARRGRRVLMLASTGLGPTEISKETGYSREHVHRVLRRKLAEYREAQMIGRLRGDVA